MRNLLLALLVAGTAFSVMLRSGYSSETVQRERSIRRFAESCDAAAEKALIGARATPALIDTHLAGSDTLAQKKNCPSLCGGKSPL
jgi:hypothetical protein